MRELKLSTWTGLGELDDQDDFGSSQAAPIACIGGREDRHAGLRTACEWPVCERHAVTKHENK
jgi:hypothetical protein